MTILLEERRNGKRKQYRWGIPLAKYPLTRPRSRWEDIIENDLKERFCEAGAGSCTTLGFIISSVNYQTGQCHIIHTFLNICLDED
jgi:hypothetical protein